MNEFLPNDVIAADDPHGIRGIVAVVMSCDGSVLMCQDVNSIAQGRSGLTSVPIRFARLIHRPDMTAELTEQLTTAHATQETLQGEIVVKDAEIARLRAVLESIANRKTGVSSIYISVLQDMARQALGIKRELEYED